MSEEEKITAEAEEKKRNIMEIALPFQKIGAMSSLPVILALIPFAIWTAFRYYRGGFPLGQIGLYILFLAALVIGQHFLFAFYAFYDRDLQTIGVGQYLLNAVKDELPVSKITSVQVHTVEIKERKISVDILPRFAKGVYKVYRFDTDKVQVAELGDKKYDISATIWLYRNGDIEKFEAMLREAISDSQSTAKIERFDDVIDWKDYQKMFKTEESAESEA